MGILVESLGGKRQAWKTSFTVEFSKASLVRAEVLGVPYLVVSLIGFIVHDLEGG